MKKEIKLTRPKVVGYLHHAYPLAVMQEHPSFLPWFYSNYLQLFCYKDFIGDACPINFYRYHDWNYYPLLDHQMIKRDQIPNLDVLDFVMHNLNRDYCVYTYVNEYYVPGRTSYMERDNDHDILVTGYDQTVRAFTVTSFINGEYVPFSLSFDEFQTAFLKVGTSFDYVKNIRLFKPNDSFAFSFDINLVKEMLLDYLLSRNTTDRFSSFYNDKQLVFGMSVYNEMFTFVDRIKDKLVDDGAYDVRPFHILWEHKVIMYERIRYINGLNCTGSTQVEGIVKKYEEVVQRADKIRFLILMHLKTKRTRYLDNLGEAIKELEQLERDILTEWRDTF